MIGGMELPEAMRAKRFADARCLSLRMGFRLVSFLS